jgi:hypothetical protein
MSHHNKEFPRQAELNKALKDHGLAVNKPSQLADAFRFGWRAMFELAAPSQPEGADDPLAKAILKGLTSKQLRDKALYLMALNANQARAIDALQADKYCSQCRKTKGADPALGADLHKFMDAAAGEGLVLDGVDAADLYVKLFPAEYAALSAPKGEEGTP